MWGGAKWKQPDGNYVPFNGIVFWAFKLKRTFLFDPHTCKLQIQSFTDEPVTHDLIAFNEVLGAQDQLFTEALSAILLAGSDPDSKMLTGGEHVDTHYALSQILRGLGYPAHADVILRGGPDDLKVSL